MPVKGEATLDFSKKNPTPTFFEKSRVGLPLD
jgi:hypothetical protein